jgi:hypothetical protein
MPISQFNVGAVTANTLPGPYQSFSPPRRAVLLLLAVEDAVVAAAEAAHLAEAKINHLLFIFLKIPF